MSEQATLFGESAYFTTGAISGKKIKVVKLGKNTYGKKCDVRLLLGERMARRI